MSFKRYNNRDDASQLPKGGIKARSEEGGFHESWWSYQWVLALERKAPRSRLMAGRAYARQGHVYDITISPGEIRAQVAENDQELKPVVIQLKTMTPQEWEPLLQALSDRPMLIARMLVNELPEQIEKICEEKSIPLIPQTLRGIRAHCFCSDRAVPCSHMAAIHYLVAEALDQDPLLLFEFRGYPREELFEKLGLTSAESGKMKSEISEQATHLIPDTGDAPEDGRLPDNLESFWRDFDNQEFPHEPGGIPKVPAALPKRLGPLPFWRSEEDFFDAMESIYHEASISAMDLFLGERKDEDED